MNKKILLLSFLLSSSLFSNDDFDKEFETNKSIEQENIILEKYNRGMTEFNDKTFTYVFKPLGQGFEYIVPKEGRESINNFFSNILFPIKFTNSILQLKFDKTLIESERFIINSTFGLLGFMDPAKNELNLIVSSEDFGQTLGYYGIPSGPHIVLPILGPSNLRDSIGLVSDYYLNPTNYIDSRSYNLYKDSEHSYYYNGIDKLNKVSLNYKMYDSLKKDSLDLYPYLKSVYTDYRNNLIKE